jgi:hypothetical protein
MIIICVSITQSKSIKTLRLIFCLTRFWYASEYLYRHATQKYCLAAETQSGNEIMMGGTILRQHIFAFDIAKW